MGSDVGGTWYWNRYPGARCDVESMQYSYSFSDDLQQEWRWGERYAAQPEILSYARHVADRFDLRRDILFDTKVVSARFDEAGARWTLHTECERTFTARFCVMAPGCLSAGRLPDIAGMDSFGGRSFHTSDWPRDGVDLSGQRVGVIGTGSSAIQAIPILAQQAAELVVFQRTPNYVIPARNAPMTDEHEAAWKQDYAARRLKTRMLRSGIDYKFGDIGALEATADQHVAAFEERWVGGGLGFMAAFTDLALDRDANEIAAEFVRAKIRGVVHDPAVAAMLTPVDYPIGTKRLCIDTGYFETFNRSNVRLVDLRATPIETVTQSGLRTTAAAYELDSLVYATGFDAMTGPLLRLNIQGQGGRRLADEWAAGPRSYLGLMVAGFPNLFTVTGPGSPSVLSNMIVSIEQHVDWIAGCLQHMQAAGLTMIEADEAAQDAWVAHVNEVAHRTLYPPRQLLVHGRQRPRQAAGVHAVSGRRGRVSRAVRCGGCVRLRGVSAQPRRRAGRRRRVMPVRARPRARWPLRSRRGRTCRTGGPHRA